MRSGPLLTVIAALAGGLLMWVAVDAPHPEREIARPTAEADAQTVAGPDAGADAETGMPVLDEQSFPLLEEHDGRLVARVQVQIVRLETPDGPRAQLRMRPTALAPGIEPPVGFRGVRGGNLQTARELRGDETAGPAAGVERSGER